MQKQQSFFSWTAVQNMIRFLAQPVQHQTFAQLFWVIGEIETDKKCDNLLHITQIQPC